jgi:hypothetical protein
MNTCARNRRRREAICHRSVIYHLRAESRCEMSLDGSKCPAAGTDNSANSFLASGCLRSCYCA